MTFNWGIIGSGRVACEFASQLANIEHANLLGVCSRSLENAQVFGNAFNADHVFTNAEDLLNTESLQAIYIAVPTALHKHYCSLALKRGIPVLCEKPLGMSAEEVREVIALAQSQNTFCMEAMWMRFSPIIQALKELHVDGRLGTITGINIQAGNATSQARLKEEGDLGRGALLNFGPYCVSFAHLFLGVPTQIKSEVLGFDNGVDHTSSTILKYPDALATIALSAQTPMNNEAVINATKATVRIRGPFFSPSSIEIIYAKAPPERSANAFKPHNTRGMAERIPYLSLLQGSFTLALLRNRGKVLLKRKNDNGMRMEALEVMQCVTRGDTESKIVSLTDSLCAATMLDEIRKP